MFGNTENEITFVLPKQFSRGKKTNKMNTQSKFTVTNTQTNWSKSNMTFEEVRKFHFTKMSKGNFSPVAVVDYQITDEVSKEVFNMSNMTF